MTSTQLEEVINDFDNMLSTYENDDEDEDDVFQVDEEEEEEKGCPEGFLSIIAEGDETDVVVTADCQKCHGYTPLCSECHLKLMNRPAVDDSNNNYNRKSFRIIVGGYEDDSFEVLECDTMTTPTNNNNGDCLKKQEQTLYDAEASMLANSVERHKGVTYGRGAEVIEERRNVSKVFRVLDFVDDEEPTSSDPSGDIVQNLAQGFMNDEDPHSSDPSSDIIQNAAKDFMNGEEPFLSDPSSDMVQNISREDCQSSQMFLAQADSSKYSKGDDDRVIQGLFVESTSRNGTLRRLKVPLNLCFDDVDDEEEPQDNDEDKSSVYFTPRMISDDYYNVFLSAKSQRSHNKKKISVHDEIFNISELTDSQDSQSDVFHSIINSTPEQDEDTILRSNDRNEADNSLDTEDTPDFSEESVLEHLKSIASTPERIPELTAAEELEDERCWKSVQVGANNMQIDLKSIQPYRQVLSHGGYADAERKVAIILFSGCFLPDRNRKDYAYLCDHLFFYVLSTLNELVADNYVLVYLHGATPKSCRPTFNWLKRCYQLVDRRLRKNLKGLYLVHPTFWVKALMSFSKLFVSSKFARKIQFVNTLSDLSLQIPTEHLMIPEEVLKYDALRYQSLRRHQRKS